MAAAKVTKATAATTAAAPAAAAEIRQSAATHLSEIQGARVSLTGEDRLRVEFSIQDLVKRLLPGTALGHCGGCNGCMGCSM